MSTISSRKFNQDIGSAKRDSEIAPVIITDRGKPTHVLLTYANYLDLTYDQPKLVDLLSMDHDIDFEPVKSNIQAKPVEFD